MEQPNETFPRDVVLSGADKMRTIFGGEGTVLLKFGVAKNFQNSAWFRTTFNFEREYFWNGWRYRQAVNAIIKHRPSRVKQKKMVNCGTLTTTFSWVMSIYPKSTLRFLRMLMHWSSGHVTLLRKECELSKLSSQSDLGRRANSRWALSQISSSSIFSRAQKISYRNSFQCLLSAGVVSEWDLRHDSVSQPGLTRPVLSLLDLTLPSLRVNMLSEYQFLVYTAYRWVCCIVFIFCCNLYNNILKTTTELLASRLKL